MTDVLLDTHTFLWGLSDSRELSPTARDVLREDTCRKSLSLASIWEMAIKRGLGKLTTPIPLDQALTLASTNGLRLTEIKLAYVLAVEALPPHHRDPFDRLLIAHCLSESVAVVSRDEIFDAYGVRRIW